jgi:hypothetical protein
MFELDRDVKKSTDQYPQDFSDKKFEFFVFHLMLAFEVQKYVETSFKSYDFTSKLDNLFFEIDNGAHRTFRIKRL